MPKRITTAATLVLGAAAGAVMALAPIASAEPTPCNPDDVQCQQQQKQPDPAAIVGSATDQANQALNQAPAASPYPTSGPPGRRVRPDERFPDLHSTRRPRGTTG